jgi:hypothetical protein
MNIYYFLIISLLFSVSSFSQPSINHKFGEPFQNEIEMEVYDKDPNADAVYLYEIV